MKHEITTENILAAAKKCPQAKQTLEVMFPEAFKENDYFDLRKLKLIKGDREDLIFQNESSLDAGFNTGSWFFQIRNSGEYSGKAFYLDGSVMWELKKDIEGDLCLVPKKKS